MADVFDLILSVNLPDTLSETEISELRWHLGLAPQPAVLSLVTDYAEPLIGDDGKPEEDEQGNWLTVYEPYPVLDGNGRPAARVGGVLVGALEPGIHGGWALMARDEVHPDAFDRLGELLVWLHERAVDSLAFQCHTRFYEETAFTPVSVSDGEVIWP